LGPIPSSMIWAIRHWWSDRDLSQKVLDVH
jgi:hypothetical protein